MEILARGVGRRKEAVAQVQIVKGTGKFVINNIPAQQYLHNNTYSMLSVKGPLNTFTTLNSSNSTTNENGVVNSEINNSTTLTLENQKNFENFDTIVKVKGGGLIGQAEAIKLGLARAICCLTKSEISSSLAFNEEEIRKQLKDKGYLTQDSRIKERRKYGLKKARKATQYNKR